MTSSSKPDGSPAIHIWNSHLDFLPSDGDFTIVCSDSGLKIKKGIKTKGALNAFKVKQSHLAQHSSFFKDLFEMTVSDSGAEVHVEEEGETVLLVLRVIYQWFCESYHPWNTLIKALRLAAKWDMEAARAEIFDNMVECVAEEAGTAPFKQDGKLKPADLTDFFVEAQRGGQKTLKDACNLLEARAEEMEGPLEITELRIEQRHVNEIGVKGVAAIERRIKNLIKSGALRRSRR